MQGSSPGTWGGWLLALAANIRPALGIETGPGLPLRRPPTMK
jgi:hypothetical protein